MLAFLMGFLKLINFDEQYGVYTTYVYSLNFDLAETLFADSRIFIEDSRRAKTLLPPQSGVAKNTNCKRINRKQIMRK